MSDGTQRPEPRYVLDTSALVDLKNEYPPKLFPSLWSKFNALCSAGEIIAPREVRKEIELGSDELLDWVKEYSTIFLAPTASEGAFTGKLQVDNPNWVDPNGTKPMADPFVLAMAKDRDLPLISHDKKQLLHVAKQIGVKCVRIPELVEREGWKF